MLADLVDAGGVLPDIKPGVLFDGDDIGRWLTRQKRPGTWAQLSAEQQERLTALGVKPAEVVPGAPAATPAAKGRATTIRSTRRTPAGRPTRWKSCWTRSCVLTGL
ncbi:helicase associated domain-containing protein [Streptomyces sp. NPDC057565]|uniref:helicase associated domain-containing protein n=1 Tax=Streptomyces sp. NPDC057565 TaxID=3346169 RepID=UPI0036B4E4F3